MKNFFCKYLPVEGEIKEDELVNTQFHHVTNGQSFIVESFDKNKTWGYQIVWNNGSISYYSKNYLEGFINSNWKRNRMKFFLCSKDIEVGDKIGHLNMPNLIPIRVDRIDLNEYICELHNNGSSLGNMCNTIEKEFAYKVIGEISEDAVWVKENDMFAEDELLVSIKSEAFNSITHLPVSKPIYLDVKISLKYMWELISEYPLVNKTYHKQSLVIHIQCPICKQFH